MSGLDGYDDRPHVKPEPTIRNGDPLVIFGLGYTRVTAFKAREGDAPDGFATSDGHMIHRDHSHWKTLGRHCAVCFGSGWHEAVSIQLSPHAIGFRVIGTVEILSAILRNRMDIKGTREEQG